MCSSDLALLRDGEPDVRARRAVGSLLVGAAALALLSLGTGNPAPLDGYDALAASTGLLGSLAAWPLAQLISATGAGIVWTGLVVLGLLLFTGTPLARVAERASDRLEVAREERRARRATEIYDQDDEDDVAADEPEDEPRSSRVRLRTRDAVVDLATGEILDDEPAAEPWAGDDDPTDMDDAGDDVEEEIGRAHV